MPTARKFHYQFNMRDFAKIVQNLLLSQPTTYKGNALGLVRMWAHECHRVWGDRLLFPEDREAYTGFMNTALKEFADHNKADAVFEQPLLYTSFIAMAKGFEPNYAPVDDMNTLR